MALRATNNREENAPAAIFWDRLLLPFKSCRLLSFVFKRL